MPRTSVLIALPAALLALSAGSASADCGKIDADIKAARKILMAVKASSEGRRPDLAPSRLHAGVTAIGTSGVKAPTSPRIIEKADSDPLGLDLKTEFEPVGVK